MAKVKKVAYDLRTLPLGEHRLISIIKLIVDADQYQKEGLFNNSPFGRIINKPYNDNFYPDEIIRNLREFFPNGLEDLWVDISYQRVLKLKKLIEHLRRKDMNGSDLLFNKITIPIWAKTNTLKYVETDDTQEPCKLCLAKSQDQEF